MSAQKKAANEIWKFVLKDASPQQLRMPFNSEVVHVAEQNGFVCLWVMVQTDDCIVSRTFSLYGTGHQIPADAVYRGTAHVGSFLWHVFEI